MFFLMLCQNILIFPVLYFTKCFHILLEEEQIAVLDKKIRKSIGV